MKAGAEKVTMMIGGDTAVGETPLSAWTVKVEVPAVVGVPDSVPATGSRVSPAGSAPLATE